MRESDGAAAAAGSAAAGSAAPASRLRLVAGRGGTLQQVFGDLGHDITSRSTTRDFTERTHSGPEIPPSLRTRQKWIAMKMTITNGRNNTCNTYQRSRVSEPISAPPSRTNLTSWPNTGV